MTEDQLKQFERAAREALDKTHTYLIFGSDPDTAEHVNHFLKLFFNHFFTILERNSDAHR